MYQRPVMWVQALPVISHGKPPPSTPLKNHENGDRTFYLQTPTKKVIKQLNQKKSLEAVKTT